MVVLPIPDVFLKKVPATSSSFYRDAPADHIFLGGTGVLHADKYIVKPPPNLAHIDFAAILHGGGMFRVGTTSGHPAHMSSFTPAVVVYLHGGAPGTPIFLEEALVPDAILRRVVLSS